MRARRGRWLLAGSVAAVLAGVGTPALNGAVRGVGAAVGRPSPVLPAPLFDVLRSDPAFAEAGEAPTPAASRVMSTLERVRQRQRVTRYQHHTVVQEARGAYRWDCSGMVSWVLARSSPRALRGVGGRRPRAFQYARRIEAAPTAGSRRGWRRIERLADLRPGDVFAWETQQRRFRRYATGHVGFVVAPPVRIRDDLWAVRIADSTSGPHQDDTRAWDGVGGTGYGTMTFQTDADGQVDAYGWWGTESPALVAAPVHFGRVH